MEAKAEEAAEAMEGVVINAIKKAVEAMVEVAKLDAKKAVKAKVEEAAEVMVEVMNLATKKAGEAAQGLTRISIIQDPAITFPDQRSCDAVRLLLDTEREALENLEALKP